MRSSHGDSFVEPLWTDSAAFANTDARKEKDGCIGRLAFLEIEV
jgi:hypothetical protein